jgi:hypothetical protein
MADDATMEVPLFKAQREALERLTESNDCQDGMKPYLMKILETKRDALEKGDDPLLRGECRRVRKLMRLANDLLECRRATASDVATGG